jgi:hypothetical protein
LQTAFENGFLGHNFPLVACNLRQFSIDKAAQDFKKNRPMAQSASRAGDPQGG